MLRPAFKRHFHVERIPGEGVFLLSERGNFVLNGRAYEELAPLLDGRLTVEEIVDAVSGKVSPMDVHYALTLLRRKGYIAEAVDGEARRQAAFYDAAGIEGEFRASREIALRVVGNLDCAEIRTAFEQNGFFVVAVPSDDVPLIVATDDYARDELREINEAALGRSAPWALFKPAGTTVWLGPLFRPGAGACWECLAHRLRWNREIERFVQQKTRATQPFAAQAALPSTIAAATALFGLELRRWQQQPDTAPAADVLITFDLLALESTRHVVMRRPQCPDCGDPGLAAAEPIAIESCSKSPAHDAAHRTATAAETVRRLEPLVSPISGVITSLTRSTAADDPRHVYVAGHNFALKHDSLFFLKKGLRSKSSGKGLTDLLARASAMCEAIERYSGIFHGDEPRFTSTLRELGESAVHPNVCMNFSERQYDTREEWNAGSSAFHLVPLRFDEERPVEWSKAWSLTHERWHHLPTAYCYFMYPNAEGEPFCWADSNGNAAGNSREEAILQAFFELVERDHVALWWYNRVRRPGVDLGSFHDPALDDLLSWYASHDRELWVLDLSADSGIPVFAAITRRTNRATQDIALGYGAHLDARVALTRALTEVAQVEPTVIRGEDGNERYGYDDRDSIRWWSTATVENQPYLLPDPASPLRTATDFAPLTTSDVADDVKRCVDVTRRLGLELLVLDQTRPDLGLPVVKVVVPGLRHFWRRFGPGRLYDVPVRLGWIDRPRGEEELNPVAMFV